MANHKSALKRVGITAKKNLRNRMITSQVKTAVKGFDAPWLATMKPPSRAATSMLLAQWTRLRRRA